MCLTSCTTGNYAIRPFLPNYHLKQMAGMSSYIPAQPMSSIEKLNWDPASATALILGATGQTGQQLISTLLSSSFYTRVGEYGRRVTAQDKVPAASKEKLEQHTIDFEKLDASGLNAKPWDVVFITCVLGLVWLPRTKN